MRKSTPADFRWEMDRANRAARRRLLLGYVAYGVTLAVVFTLAAWVWLGVL